MTDEKQDIAENTPAEAPAKEEATSSDAATTSTNKPAAKAPAQNNNRGPRNNNRGGQRGGQRGGKGRRNNRRRNAKPEKEFDEELIQIDRVTRVVKGGRRLRFRATVVIGDRKGRVGFGIDKALEVPQAIQKAVRNAKKNMITVPMHKGTIPHEVTHKFKSAKIRIMPAKPGTGVIAGGAMRKIADLAGIQDILGKSTGTRNRVTTGKAMIEALASLAQPKKAPKETSKEEAPKKEAVAA